MPRKKEPGSVGRPRKVKPIGRPKWKPNLAEVERLAGQGLTFYQIANYFGIHEDTMYQRCKDLPGFSEAIKRGRASGIDKMSGKLFETGMKGNVQAQMFYLRAIGKWRDNDPVVDSDRTLKVDALKIEMIQPPPAPEPPEPQPEVDDPLDGFGK
jgi:hypothetical protein